MEWRTCRAGLRQTEERSPALHRFFRVRDQHAGPAAERQPVARLQPARHNEGMAVPFEWQGPAAVMAHRNATRDLVRWRELPVGDWLARLQGIDVAPAPSPGLRIPRNVIENSGRRD
jgi:hypothetical protein